MSKHSLTRWSTSDPEMDALWRRVVIGTVQDFGLRELLMHTRVGRSAKEGDAMLFEQRWVASQVQNGGPSARELSGGLTLAAASLGLRPGDVLEYKAAAADFADDAFLRTSESEVFRVVVISELEHLNRVLSKLRGIQIELLRLAAKQRVEAVGAGQLAEKAPSEPIEQPARDAEARERDLARSTDKTAGDVEEILAEMARNPAASAEVLADMERLGRAVRAVADEPMEQAAEKMGEASENRSPAEQKGAEQARSMKEAQKLGDEAARQLERLAAAVEAMQTRGQMDKLAAAAELLAARQRDLKEATQPVAVKTVGTPKEDLSDELKKAIENLAGEEGSIKEGIDALDKEIRSAATKMSDTNPSAAAQAEQASGQMDSDKLSEKAAAIAQAMKENVLFSKLADQEELARKLAELAKRLRDGQEQEAGEQVIKEIEKFIARQKQIIRGVGAAIAKARDAKTGPALGQEQAALERDVSEQAAAILLLARELAGFESLTAVKLEAAADEMRPGANELYLSRLPEGLAHAEKALALLEDARKQAEAEKEQMNQAGQQCKSMQAALLLQRIINAQQQVNEGTAAADEARADADAFSRRAAELARKQTLVKVDTDRLIGMVKPLSAETAEYIGQAGEKMDVSRLALSSGDTGKQTRIVQREIVAMLEPLLKECQQQMGSQGLAGARMKALMQMLALLQQPGASPGGFAGGTNAPILPSSLGQVGDESWRRARQRLEQQLGAGYDADFPAEYKDLLNAYFDRLRKQPPR